MSIKFIYKILPAFIFKVHTDDGSSQAFANIILIDENATEGVLEHELIHIRQNYRTLGIATVLYKLSQRFRLMYEVEAFKKQIEVDGLNNLEIIRISEILADDYNIDYVSVADIFASLKG